jgi:hypothetical protein
MISLAKSAGAPIFIITACSREEDLEKMMGGAEGERPRVPDGDLEKPISVPAFLRRVHELFERPREEIRRG